MCVFVHMYMCVYVYDFVCVYVFMLFIVNPGVFLTAGKLKLNESLTVLCCVVVHRKTSRMPLKSWALGTGSLPGSST